MSIFSFTLFGIHIAPTWYGLMYALGFILGYLILRSRKILSETELDSLVFYVFLGVILGGRLGYVLFYDLGYYLAHPIDILKTWNGGMSFHGGVIGVITAMFVFSKKHKKSFLSVADQVTSILPIGLGLGRIGNYVNKELLGFTPYTWPLSVEKNGISYFPSPLLESFLEWIILFLILSYVMRKKAFSWEVAMHFLVWYGIFRFVIEFFRLPDTQLGYVFGWLTMGQILSLPMICIGVLLLLRYRKKI